MIDEEAADLEAGRHDPVHPLRSTSERRSERVAFAGVIVLAFVLVTLHVWSAPMLSPIDELQHIDYLAKASHAQLPRQGDLIGETAMRAEACRGIEAQWAPPPCASPTLRPDQFQERGQNTAYGDPPLYYFATGFAARVISAITGRDFVTTGRLLGFAWLALGLALTWAAMASLDVPLAGRVVASAVLLASPVVLNSSATITSDAILLPAGAAMLWGVLRWEEGRLPTWVFVAIAAVAALGKTTALVGIALAGAYLLVRITAPGVATPSTARRLRAAALAAVAGIAVIGVWSLINTATARVGPLAIDMNRRFRVDSLGAGAVLRELTATITPFARPFVARPLNAASTSVTSDITDWLFIGTLLGAIFHARQRGRIELLAGATVATLVATGPALAVVTFVVSRVNFPIPPRYGLAAAPAMASLLGASLHKRWVLLVAGCFAALAASSVAFLLAVNH